MAKKDASKEQIELLNKAQSTAKSIGVSEENIAQLQQRILDGRIKSYQALVNELKVLQEITAEEKDVLRIQKETLQIQEKQKKVQAELAEFETDLAKAYNSLKKSKYEIAGATDDEFDATKKIVSAKREELRILRESGSIETDRIKALEDTLREMQGIVNTAQEFRDKFGADTLTSINEGFDTLQDKIDKLTSFLPKGVSRALGLDTLANDLKEAVLNGKSLSKTLLSPKVLFAAAVAAGVALFEVMQNITKQAKDFSIETGLSVAASQRLVEQSYELQASYKNQLSSQEDILSVQREVIGQLGPIAQLSGDVALRVSETGKAFGYGAQEAAKVQSQMMQISGYSQTAAIEAQEFTAQLALAEGVAPGAVMKDIAKNSAVAAKYFAGNPKALGKAAVEAAKMGMSLDQMAKSAESLLDIESSLESQFIASAMIGRQINLDTARRLAITGDIAGANKEILKQVGSLAEYESMLPMQREALAKAVGMTTEELSKSLAVEQMRGQLTEDELAAMSGLNVSAAALKNMTADQVREQLASKQATEELATSFEKIKSALTRFILPIAKALMPIFEGLAALVEGMLAPFQIIGDLLSMFVGWISQLTGGLGSSIDMGKALAVTLKGVGVVLGLMAIKGVVSAITSIFTSLGAIPFIGIGLAAAAVGAMFAAIGAGTSMVQSTMDDGEMGPVGPSGYSRVLSGPEGSIALNDKDTVVTGTNLNQGASASVTIDYDKLGMAVANAVQKLKIIIDESAVAAINKQGAVNASFR